MASVFSCENLSKRYGRITALKNVTLGVDTGGAVEPGVIGLLGPNGAGKSTLISVLLGQTPATSGQASVLGLDIRRKQRHIRRRIGFVPENDCLIPQLTGTGYVHYAGRLAGMSYSDAMRRTHEALDYVGLGEARYRQAEEYSAGMRQRLKLAQALVHDPDLLFLDEPTNGMDPHGRQTMLSLISDLAEKGISLLLSSHLLPDVEKVCERVIIMSGGEVLSTGRISEMNKPHPTLYMIEYSGDDGAFQRQLSLRNVSVLDHTEGQLNVELPEQSAQNTILEAARSSYVKLHGLHPKRSSLEETFMAAIQGQGNK